MGWGSTGSESILVPGSTGSEPILVPGKTLVCCACSHSAVFGDAWYIGSFQFILCNASVNEKLEVDIEGE